MKFKMNVDALELLRRIGLNLYESKVYLALLSAGKSSASELSDLAGIPRPRTYDVLDKLEKRGFISTQPGRPTIFSATPASEAFVLLKKQRQHAFERELAELGAIEAALCEKVKEVKPVYDEEKEFVWLLRDKSNIHSKLEGLIKNAKTKILISSTASGLRRKNELYRDHLREAKKRGVDVKMKESNHRVVIADDHVLLFLTPEAADKKEIGAWIRSPFLAENMRSALGGR